jgi:hypothetical protein
MNGRFSSCCESGQDMESTLDSAVSIIGNPASMFELRIQSGGVCGCHRFEEEHMAITTGRAVLYYGQGASTAEVWDLAANVLRWLGQRIGGSITEQAEPPVWFA